MKCDKTEYHCCHVLVWLNCPTYSTSIELSPTIELPDIVLISIDTLRADRVGAYGDSKAKTPNIDKLAQKSVLFREAPTCYSVDAASSSSMLTGMLPSKHGVRDNAGYSLAPAHDTVAEAANREFGYSTAAFISAFCS